MTTAGRVDGRQARGERARAALIAATLAVIEREGISGVTHRNVTRVAGLPATSAAYHFDTIHDLLEAALRWADDQSKQALVGIAAAEDPIKALTCWLVADFQHDRARCLAEYELFLYSARTPALRPTAVRWMTDLTELVSQWTDDQVAARTICAYVDGLILQALVTNEAPDPAMFADTIRALLGSACAQPASLAEGPGCDVSVTG